MLVLWLVEKGLTTMKCGVYSPLNDCCALGGAHFGPHVSKDKAEWFGGVWLQEPAPKPEPESQYDKLIDRGRKQRHATPSLGGFYDENDAKSPEQLAAMRRCNAAELYRRNRIADSDQQLKDFDIWLARSWAEHVAEMQFGRELMQQSKLRDNLIVFIAVAVALVLFVFLLSLI
jgi:hypothetical protein